jgi:hypothetical protein
MDDDLDDLGICVLNDECELIEKTLSTMKYIWAALVISGVVAYLQK